jgi:hypothetical protein
VAAHLVLPCLLAAGAEQMGCDELLLDEARKPVARRYVWDPPAVSLGKFQRCPEIAISVMGAAAAARRRCPPAGACAPSARRRLRVVLRPGLTRAAIAVAAGPYRFVNDASLPLCARRRRADSPVSAPSAPVLLPTPATTFVGGEKVVAIAQAR